jgi:alpha-glucosidase
LNIQYNTINTDENDKIYLLNESFIQEAIFSDETQNFRNPVEPENNETVKVRLRTARNNIDRVYIACNNKRLETVKIYSEAIFDYYEGDIVLSDTMVEYCFELQRNEEVFFYNKLGITREIVADYNFKIIPNFKTPDWAKGSIMYQIYVDRFCDGDQDNNVCDNEYIYLGKPALHIRDWNKYPEADDVRNFYGGDLKGVIDRLEYLSDLGVEVIYFNPIFVSPSNHKYDIQDYDYVDPHIGVIVEDGGENLDQAHFHNKFASKYIKRTTEKVNLEASNKLFGLLIEKAHSKGIKVILDGVFNHCGAFNKWLDREGFYNSVLGYPVGAYRQKESPYNDYFLWYDRENWPNNDCYDGWWGFDNHPKLNYEGSKELYDYILSVGAKWVSPPYNADGWRLDVAADLGKSSEFNHKFWKDFRKAVKSANPEAIILAEHYGDASSWLEGDEWDSIMNYDAFMEPITWFLTGMEKHSDAFNADLLCNADAFVSAMKYHMSKFSIQSLQISMNELSNHDHSRFLTRTNMTPGRVNTHGPEAAALNINKGIMKEAITFQMTWPGSPTIYYADEAGTVGWTDPDNRRTYPWGYEDKDLLEYHKATIAIHKSYSALKTGSVEYLECSYGIISYGRFNEENKLIVVLNNNNEQRTVDIAAWRIGIKMSSNLRRLILSTKEEFDINQEYYAVSEGKLEITLPAYSSVILVEE